MLGDGGALEAVQGLVDQSLLSIRDAAGGLRYRMLETVREFGRIQLIEAGDLDDARAARRAWATAYAGSHGDGLTGAGQFASIDAIAAEEVNLADELRDAIGEGDNDAAIVLLAALGHVLDDPRRARPAGRPDGRGRRSGLAIGGRRPSSRTPPVGRWRSC